MSIHSFFGKCMSPFFYFPFVFQFLKDANFKQIPSINFTYYWTRLTCGAHPRCSIQTSSLTHSSHGDIVRTWKGSELLTSLLALGSAPWCSNSVTASMWPAAAASIRGVVPSWKRRSQLSGLVAKLRSDDSISRETFLPANALLPAVECMPYFLIDSWQVIKIILNLSGNTRVN